MVQAINPKHQKQVNKAAKALQSYNTNNDLRDKADDMGDVKAYRRFDNLCQKYFDKYLEACDELPEREKENIDKQLY